MKNNTKSFVVTAEFKINRAVWRTLGYGDQPSKAEVTGSVLNFLETLSSPSAAITGETRYMGAPGHYKIFANLTVDQPWWRRAGFGDTVSVEEVKVNLDDFLRRLSTEFHTSVSSSH